MYRKSEYIDFPLKTGYIGNNKRKNISTDRYFKLHIYLRTNKTLIRNSLTHISQLGGGGGN
jgi:hypothetical protein